jgi:hypothetical protein
MQPRLDAATARSTAADHSILEYKLTLQTPAKYWRIARTLEEMEDCPPELLVLPANLANHSSPPKAGHDILLADYDSETESGLIRHLGVVREVSGETAIVSWTPAHIEIWVDTPAGRKFWKAPGGFGFAPKKVPGYGLHEMFCKHFPGMVAREPLPDGFKPPVRSTPVRKSRVAPATKSRIAPERLNPIEVVGQPENTPRGGYVYVLESAYGFKVGRTRNVPSRMRAFGVKLPIAYTIPLCVWFDDHIDAESSYHRMFSEKRINGEWFELGAEDIDLIRQRAYA